jgi:NADH-quinone oxidoreductase subunit L
MQETTGFALQTAASGITEFLWLIPAVPMVAAGVIALLKQPKRKLAATLAIGSLAFSLLLALLAFGPGDGDLRRSAHLYLFDRLHGA